MSALAAERVLRTEPDELPALPGIRGVPPVRVSRTSLLTPLEPPVKLQPDLTLPRRALSKLLAFDLAVLCEVVQLPLRGVKAVTVGVPGTVTL